MSRDHNQQSSKKILCFAREAGGAEAIAPVIHRLKEKYPVHLLAKDYATQVFKRQNLQYEDISLCSDLVSLEKRVQELCPAIIFTSATSLPWNDMTERYLWKCGADHTIPTIAVIDQWQNYALRFSGPKDHERLAYLPDYICTLDEPAKIQMVTEKIPENRIIVTGQPAFDAIAAFKKAFPLSRDKILKQVGLLNTPYKTIVFVSEALFRDFQNNLGYTEVDALVMLLETLKAESRENGSEKFNVIIKLHPQNNPDDFSSISFGEYTDFITFTWIATDLPPRDVVMIGDIIIGMASILLVESILLKKLTISLQPNSISDDNLIATKIGAIPLIRKKQDLQKILHLLLTGDEYRTAYMETQAKLQTDGCAAERIADLIEQTIRRK